MYFSRTGADRFLLAESPVSRGVKYRSWICPDIISEHSPICLQLDFNDSGHRTPFKFNLSWLKESFHALVCDCWQGCQFDPSLSATALWHPKMPHLKVDVKRWAGNHIRKQQRELECIEACISSCQSSFISSVFPEALKSDLCFLAERKDHLLKAEEERWYLKGRAIWFREGDGNTVFSQICLPQEK